MLILVLMYLDYTVVRLYGRPLIWRDPKETVIWQPYMKSVIWWTLFKSNLRETTDLAQVFLGSRSAKS